MKKVKIFSTILDFEKFVNRTDIEVIQIDIKAVEQSSIFQECFVAVVYYKTIM